MDGQSLEEIEHDAWGDPPAGATRLIRTAHALRRKPIDALTVEDLRLLLGQRIGTTVLLPHALRRLRADPLAEGDLYPGDLLVAALRQPAQHWRAHPEQAAALAAIARAVDPAQLPELPALLTSLAPYG